MHARRILCVALATAVLALVGVAVASAARDNDDLAKATKINTKRLPVSVSRDIVGATTEDQEPLDECAVSYTRTVWYRFEVPEQALYHVNTLGSSFDTVLVLYASDARKKATYDDLRFNDCNDDSVFGGRTSDIHAYLAPGVYYIQASEFASFSPAPDTVPRDLVLNVGLGD